MGFFKKKKNIQPTIEYIENKYKIKLTYPYQIIDKSILIFDDNFYDEIRNFGCSDIIYGTCMIHKNCICSGKFIFDPDTGKPIEKIKRKCDNCNYYPVVKEYQDSLDVKKVRLKKINKLNEFIKR